MTSSPTRPTRATSSRGCHEDATRKLLPWNLSLIEHVIKRNDVPALECRRRLPSSGAVAAVSASSAPFTNFQTELNWTELTPFVHTTHACAERCVSCERRQCFQRVAYPPVSAPFRISHHSASENRDCVRYERVFTHTVRRHRPVLTSLSPSFTWIGR